MKIEKGTIQVCPLTKVSVLLKSIRIIANFLPKEKISFVAGAVYVILAQWVIIDNNTFQNNTGGIYASNTNVVNVGNVTFEDNIGVYGGAIQITASVTSTTVSILCTVWGQATLP